MPAIGRPAARARGACPQAVRRLPSLADRVRVRAVCRAWRRIADEERLPPPVPWLTLFDGTFLSIADGGEIHRVPVLEDASLYGSMGNWLFILQRPGPGGKLALTNPFSKCVVDVPVKANGYRGDSIFFKLVPLSTPDDLSLDSVSDLDSLFAVLIVGLNYQCVISIGSGRHPSAIALEIPQYILDVAFFEGKLYALSAKTLCVIEIVSSYQGGKLQDISSIDAVEDPGFVDVSIADKTYITFYWSYLAEYSGKLVQIRRLLRGLSALPEYDDSSKEEANLEAGNCVTILFEVFELDLTINSQHKWTKLDTLGDQALFVGINSKFLPASECGAQQNSIYFACDYDREHWPTDPFHDCGVFNMSTGIITPLLPDITFVHSQGCKGLPTWFFPTSDATSRVASSGHHTLA